MRRDGTATLPFTIDKIRLLGFTTLHDSRRYTIPRCLGPSHPDIKARCAVLIYLILPPRSRLPPSRLSKRFYRTPARTGALAAPLHPRRHACAGVSDFAQWLVLQFIAGRLGTLMVTRWPCGWRNSLRAAELPLAARTHTTLLTPHFLHMQRGRSVRRRLRPLPWPLS
jgi:hypothetical protein